MHFTPALLAIAASFAAITSAAPVTPENADLAKRLCPTLKRRELGSESLSARDINLLAKKACAPLIWDGNVAEAEEDSELAKRLCPLLKRRDFDATSLGARDIDLLVERACAPFIWSGSVSEADE